MILLKKWQIDRDGNDNEIRFFYSFLVSKKRAFRGNCQFMEVFWPVGTEKSITDCGLAEFQIRQVLLYGKVVCA